MLILWHERLGHLVPSMMCRIVQNSNDHLLRGRQILTSPDFTCAACFKGKLIIRSSFTKVMSKSPGFLERINGYICGPIHPPSGLFRYFMILIDRPIGGLLSTRNVVLDTLLAQIIRLRGQFPNHPIKTICLDNASEFLSQSFRNYWISLDIDV